MASCIRRALLRLLIPAAVLFCLADGLGSQAEVKIPKPLGNHAVLQRNLPIHLCGWTAADALVGQTDLRARLALVARTTVYGGSIEYSEPLFWPGPSENHAWRLWSDHADGMKAPGGEVVGFKAAGGDYVDAQTRIEGSSVVVESPSVADPQMVRHGGANWSKGNEVNAVGAPAASFCAMLGLPVRCRFLGVRSCGQCEKLISA